MKIGLQVWFKKFDATVTKIYLRRCLEWRFE